MVAVSEVEVGVVELGGFGRLVVAIIGAGGGGFLGFG